MIDWHITGQEAANLLSGYLKIPSLNPPGDEIESARYLSEALEARGFSVKSFDSAPRRRNLVSRLPGSGEKGAVLLYNHMDVVEVSRDEWSVDPFGGLIRDGFIYGRGALDMKGMAIMQLMAMNLLKKNHPKRTRDIIFLAAADEEKGGHFGAEWMVEHHWDELRCEYVWDEGGFGLKDFFGPQTVFTISLAEKQDLWLKLIVHGEPGHGGMPRDDHAVNVLLSALEKIRRINLQYRVHPITRRMFNGISQGLSFPASFLLGHLQNPLAFRLARPALLSNPTIAAMLRDTISITILRAGGKENVVPDLAEAVLDVRLLPDRSPEEFLEGLKAMIADQRVAIEILQQAAPAAETSADSEFYNCLQNCLKILVPEAVSVPMLTPGTTDSCYFRRKGVNSYGLVPIVIDPAEFAGFHGHNERISIDNLILGTRVIYEVLSELTRP